MPYKGGCAFQPIAIETGDIEIGAVEVKDAVVDRRAAVINVAGTNRLAVDTGGGGGGGNATIVGNTQIQNVETNTPLGAGGSFTSTGRDCEKYAGFGISLYLARVLATNLTVIVEESIDNVAFVTRDRIEVDMPLTAPQTTLVSRVFAVTRRYMRITITNNTVNPMMSTELITMMKPIP
jgi:hypothetical protein